jgi:hypothetical protein
MAKPIKKTTAATPTAKTVEYGPFPTSEGLDSVDELSWLFGGAGSGGGETEVFEEGGAAGLIQPAGVQA